MGRKKTKTTFEDRLDEDEELVDDSDPFAYVDYGSEAIASFSFTGNQGTPDKTGSEPAPLISSAAPEAAAGEVKVQEKLIDNRAKKSQPYGITPPVDGEHFEIRRTFKFRRSTVKLLNKLKAEHEDENVYLSSIVDEALRFYYAHVMEE